MAASDVESQADDTPAEAPVESSARDEPQASPPVGASRFTRACGSWRSWPCH